MTVIHFALSKFFPSVSAEKKAEIFKQADEIIKNIQIPGLIRITAGSPLDSTHTKGYDFALTAEFEDIRGFQAYLPNKDHIRLLRLTKGLADPASLISYQIDTKAKAKL
ncbi:hypothetical protein ONZ45_g19427 [Pleurotus djamor]|nr:hypothetical protein ONZ45_g19427 [Pleurotus djamor]